MEAFYKIIFCIIILSGLGCSAKESNVKRTVLSVRSSESNLNLSAKISASQLKLHVFLYHTANVSENDLRLIDDALRHYYKAIVVRKGALHIPSRYINPKSGKMNSDSILDFMDRILVDSMGKRLLITDKVISTTRNLHGKVFYDWTIMGYGQIGGRNCVVSSATLKTNKTERFKKVVLHEIGHTLGANHCETSDTCLMLDLKGVGSAIDKSSFYMCGECKKRAVIIN